MKKNINNGFMDGFAMGMQELFIQNGWLSYRRNPVASS